MRLNLALAARTTRCRSNVHEVSVPRFGAGAARRKPAGFEAFAETEGRFPGGTRTRAPLFSGLTGRSTPF
jgi:hypothetical protein